MIRETLTLVSGAGGKTGRAMVAALARSGQAVRAFVRSATHAADLTRLGASEIAVGSMDEARAFAAAAHGCRAIYHICPNVSVDEERFAEHAIAAARAAGIGRFVYHSVLHPQIEAMPHHWRKLRVEEMLFASGLDVTVLQPTAYMQNLTAAWPAMMRDGVLRVPYPVTTAISLVDLDDVAQVAARVLGEEGHGGATYELVGTAALSQIEVAAILSASLGRPVVAQSEPVESWEGRARAAGMGDPERAALAAMFRYYAAHGLKGNPGVLGFLLGRPPTSLAEFARRFGQLAWTEA